MYFLDTSSYNDVKILSQDELEQGKKTHWEALRIIAGVRVIAPNLFNKIFLTQLILSHNQLRTLPDLFYKLRRLVHLDISYNYLEELPKSICKLMKLQVLLLDHNQLTQLPNNLGKLSSLLELSINDNPLHDKHLLEYDKSNARGLLRYLLDRLLGHIFSVMSYNVLYKNQANNSTFTYCPSWALDWEYRCTLIIQGIFDRPADIICLQEADAEDVRHRWALAFQSMGYAASFGAKALHHNWRHNGGREGCLTLFNTARYSYISDYVVAYDQLLMNQNQCLHYLHQAILSKGDVALVTIFNIHGQNLNENLGPLIVVNTQLTEDNGDYPDEFIKRIQFMLLLSEIHEKAVLLARDYHCSPTSIPIIICGDFNFTLGHLGQNLAKCLIDRIKGQQREKSVIKYPPCYNTFIEMTAHKRDLYTQLVPANKAVNVPCTVRTPQLVGIKDYIYYNKRCQELLSVLEGYKEDWIAENNIVGFPIPSVPSTHIPLYAQFGLPLYRFPAFKAK